MTGTHRLGRFRGAVVLILGMLTIGVGLYAARAPQGAAGPIEREDRHTGNRNRRLDVVVARITAKERIVAALLDERISFLEAAGRFRRLDQVAPSIYTAAFRALFTESSEEEMYCRQVLEWVRHAGTVQDSHCTTAVYTRLENELQAHLRRGPLCLPPGGERQADLPPACRGQ